MNKETLKELGLTDEQIAEIQKLKGEAIKEQEQANEKLQKDLEKAKADLKNVKEQMASKEELFTSYETKIAELEKAGVDKEGLKKLIEEQKALTEAKDVELTTLRETQEKELYDRDLRDALDKKIDEYLRNENLKIDSLSAKNAIINNMKAKVSLDNGSLIGFDDIITIEKANDPGAFSSTLKEELPQIVGSTGSNPVPKTDDSDWNPSGSDTPRFTKI